MNEQDPRRKELINLVTQATNECLGIYGTVIPSIVADNLLKTQQIITLPQPIGAPIYIITLDVCEPYVAEWQGDEDDWLYAMSEHMFENKEAFLTREEAEVHLQEMLKGDDDNGN